MLRPRSSQRKGLSQPSLPRPHLVFTNIKCSDVETGDRVDHVCYSSALLLVLLCKIWAFLPAYKTKTGDLIPGWGREHPDLLVLWRLQDPKLWDDHRKVKWKAAALLTAPFCSVPAALALTWTRVLNLNQLQAQNSKGILLREKWSGEEGTSFNLRSAAEIQEMLG